MYFIILAKEYGREIVIFLSDKNENTSSLVFIAQYCITKEAGSLIRIVKTVTLSNL